MYEGLLDVSIHAARVSIHADSLLNVFNANTCHKHAKSRVFVAFRVFSMPFSKNGGSNMDVFWMY
jgi:hypothetical protein